MAARYGVNFNITAEAARPFAVASVTPIAVVGTAQDLDTGISFYGSLSSALDAIKDKESSIRKSLKAMYDQNLETPIILSVFRDSTGGEDANKDANKDGDTNDKSSVGSAVEAVELVRKAENITGYRPSIIIAPFYSNKSEVASKLQVVSEQLNATGIIDLKAQNEADAVNESKTYSSKRVLLSYGGLIVFDSLLDKNVTIPLSAFIAAIMARTDGEAEYGFSDSFSNRSISGVLGSSLPVEFFPASDCEADRLRSANITTVIRHSGFRLWGGETTDQDSIWQDLARVRTFDKIADACASGVFYAIDKRASALYYARSSVEELCRNLTGSSVLLGYDVSWNKNKNTESNVTKGKFYLDVRIQNNPIVKMIELNFVYTDKYTFELLKNI